MAEAVDGNPAPPAAAPPATTRPGEERLLERPRALQGQRDYRGRFRIAYVALALVFWGIAAGVALSLTGALSRDEGPAWSLWKPSEKGLDGAKQIAAHVSSRYHVAGGRQLVAVQANAPEVQNVPLAAIAVRGAAQQDNVDIVSAKNSIVYQLCGLGERCTINVGKPTTARARLLRREALELALYTFKYVKGVDSVVALLPPPPSQDPPSWSVFFRKGELEQELKQPLRRTLPQVAPPTPETLTSVESDTIERLTRPRWFKSQFQQLQDGEAILVLDPLTTAG